MHYIDGKGHTSELKTNRSYLIVHTSLRFGLVKYSYALGEKYFLLGVTTYLHEP